MSDPAASAALEPSEWVCRFAELVPAGGPVLDIAAGRGRHTRFFQTRGHKVTAVDRNVSALAGLPGVEAVVADLEDGSTWPVSGRYSGVIVTNYLWRPILPEIVATVAEAGVLIYETFAVGNEVYGKPSRPDYLLRPGELLDATAGLVVVAYNHGIVHRPAPAVVQRICAIRFATPQPLG